MKKAVAISILLAAAGAQAQTNVASDFAVIQPGRTFHCQLMQDMTVGHAVGCRLTRPLLRDDHVTVAIGAGSWLSGPFDGANTVHWKAVQTGETEGSTIYVFGHGMESTVHGDERTGGDLLVTVQEPVRIEHELSPPEPVAEIPDTNVSRSAFYQAIMKMSSSNAQYSFMVDTMLEERCGKPQGIPALKEAVLSSELPVLLHLKDGDIDGARKILADLPCER